VACVAIMGAGCTVGDGVDGEIDEASLAPLASYQAMAKINTRPYTSSLGAFAINCYVTGDVAGYRRIHPDRSGTDVRLARGTMIVREVLDAAQQVTKLTVMAKGPPGLDPSLGDWWFAVTDPRGAPLRENGVVLLGRLAQCHECHVDRARDDFLFGVPADDS
jgi:hypothetical protein